MFDKPVRIMIYNPIKEITVDYELAGKVLDNIIVLLEEEKWEYGKKNLNRALRFTIGMEYEFSANLSETKRHFALNIYYLKQLSGDEKRRISRAVLPKDKKKVKEIEERVKADEEAKAKKTAKKKKSKDVDVDVDDED